MIFVWLRCLVEERSRPDPSGGFDVSLVSFSSRSIVSVWLKFLVEERLRPDSSGGFHVSLVSFSSGL